MSETEGASGAGSDNKPFLDPAAASSAPAPALREEQIQNAISFLSHPNVRGSPLVTRRSFLERKGLTTAEIDEALRRVPDPATLAPTVATNVAALPGATVSYLNPQPQQALQQLPSQPAQAVPLAPAPQPMQLQTVHPPPPPQPLRWTQVVLGLGAVTASVVLVQSYVVPRVVAYARSWSNAARERQEREEKREREVVAVLEALKSVQSELQASTSSMAEASRALREQAAMQQQAQAARGYQPQGVSASELRQELRSMAQTLAESSETAEMRRELHDIRLSLLQRNNTNSISAPATSDGYNAYGHRDGTRGGRPANTATRPSNGPGSGTYTTAAGSSKYGDNAYSAAFGSAPFGGAAFGTGSRASSVTEAGPAAAVHQAVVTPPPWSGAASGYSSPGREGNLSASQVTPGVMSYAQAVDNGHNPSDGAGPQRSAPPAPAEEAAYPQSFHEVMDMVAKGITPPNVRTDINDNPPDPNRPPSDARLSARPKPWEQQQREQQMAQRLVQTHDDSVLFGTEPSRPQTGGSATSTGRREGVEPTMSTWRPPPPPQATIMPRVRSSGSITSEAAAA